MKYINFIKTQILQKSSKNKKTLQKSSINCIISVRGAPNILVRKLFEKLIPVFPT